MSNTTNPAATAPVGDADEPAAVSMPAVAAAYAGVLEAHDDVNGRANALIRERRRIRTLVDAIPAGAWGEWLKSFGEPANILDEDEVRRVFAEELHRPVPMKKGNPPLEITFIGKAR